ncbi:MAG: THUMP domain-containing protein [archaeon]|jgi:hypothetical protein
MFEPNCVVVLPFSEIAIKGVQVRSFIEKRLKKNMTDYFEHYKVPCEKIIHYSGRMIVQSTEPKKVVEALRNCFGINLLFLAREERFGDLEELATIGASLCKDSFKEGNFAVRGKSFSKGFSSKKLEETIGGKILDNAPNLKVKLKNPEKEFYCISFEKKAYFYFEPIKVASGMPVGSQGRAALLVTTESKQKEVLLLGKHLLKMGCTIAIVTSEKELFFDSSSLEEFNCFKSIKVYSLAEAKELYQKQDIRAFFSSAVTLSQIKKDSRVVGFKVFAPLLF